MVVVLKLAYDNWLKILTVCSNITMVVKNPVNIRNVLKWFKHLQNISKTCKVIYHATSVLCVNSMTGV